MGDKRRQDLGMADAPSNTGSDMGRHWETRRPREGGHTIQIQAQIKGDIMGDKRRQDLAKADTPSNTGTRVGKQWQIRGDKTSGRWAHRPTQAHIGETIGHKRRQGEIRPREGERSTHKGKQWGTRGDIGETIGHKRRQGEIRPREGERSTHKGKQWGTMGDKTSGRRAHLPMGDKRRQDLEKGTQHLTSAHMREY